MHALYLCLLAAACVCFAAAAVNARTRVNLIALGLLLAFLVPAIQYIRTA